METILKYQTVGDVFLGLEKLKEQGRNLNPKSNLAKRLFLAFIGLGQQRSFNIKRPEEMRRELARLAGKEMMLEKIDNLVERQAEAVVARETTKAVERFMDNLKQDNEAAELKIEGKKEEIVKLVAKGVGKAIREGLGLEKDELELTERGEETTRETTLKTEIQAMVGEEIKTDLAIRRLDGEVENIKKANPEEVASVKRKTEREEIEAAFNRENPGATEEQRQKITEFASAIASLPSSGIEQYREMAISQQNADDQTKPALDRLGQTNTELGWQNLGATMRVLRTPADAFNKLVETKEELEKLGVKVPLSNKLVRPMDRILDLASKNPALKQSINFVQNKIAFFEKFNHFGEAVALKLGRVVVASKIGQRILGQAGVEFAKRGLAIMAEQGIATGAKAIVGQLVTKFGLDVAVKVAAGTAVGKVAVGLVTKVLGLGTGPIGWLVMAAITAVQLVWGLVKKVVGFFKNKINDLFGALGIDLESFGLGTKKFLQEHLGGFLGGVVSFGLNVGLIVATLPTILGALAIGAAMGPLLIMVFVGLFLYQMLQLNLVSTLVPPVGMGGDSDEMASSSPIYTADCMSSPACAVISYLNGKGISNVNTRNLATVAELVEKWPNPPAGFDKDYFIKIMKDNTNAYQYFQCLGFSLGIDKRLFKAEIVTLMKPLHPGCGEITDYNQVSVGDHIMYMGPHIMELSVLTKDEDGNTSYVLSHVNADYQGALTNRPGTDIAQFLADKKAVKGNLMILRCR